MAVSSSAQNKSTSLVLCHSSARRDFEASVASLKHNQDVTFDKQTKNDNKKRGKKKHLIEATGGLSDQASCVMYYKSQQKQSLAACWGDAFGIWHLLGIRHLLREAVISTVAGIQVNIHNQTLSWTKNTNLRHHVATEFQQTSCK